MSRHRAKSYKLPAGQYKRHSLGGLLLKQEQFYREGDIFSGQVWGWAEGGGELDRRIASRLSSTTAISPLPASSFQGGEFTGERHCHQYSCGRFVESRKFQSLGYGGGIIVFEKWMPPPAAVAAIEIYGRAQSKYLSRQYCKSTQLYISTFTQEIVTILWHTASVLSIQPIPINFPFHS